jgi:hypothetical protein
MRNIKTIRIAGICIIAYMLFGLNTFANAVTQQDVQQSAQVYREHLNSYHEAKFDCIMGDNTKCLQLSSVQQLMNDPVTGSFTNYTLMSSQYLRQGISNNTAEYSFANIASILNIEIKSIMGSVVTIQSPSGQSMVLFNDQFIEYVQQEYENASMRQQDEIHAYLYNERMKNDPDFAVEQTSLALASMMQQVQFWLSQVWSWAFQSMVTNSFLVSIPIVQPMRLVNDEMPVINSVSVNDGYVRIGDNVTIEVSLTGTTHMEYYYPNSTDDYYCNTFWRGCGCKRREKSITSIVSGNNPEKIRMARVYYYIPGVLNLHNELYIRYSTMSLISETDDSSTWRATIPWFELQADGIEVGDKLHFAIVAVDDAGNIVTEDLFEDKLMQGDYMPVPGGIYGYSQWDNTWALPSTHWFCPFPGYRACFDVLANTEDPHGISEFGIPVLQQTIDAINTTGLSVKASDRSLFMRLGVKGGNPAAEKSANMISTYTIIVKSNEDPTPNNCQFENSFMFYYSPEGKEYDPIYYKGLYDGACLTDPNIRYSFESNFYDNAQLGWQCKMTTTGDPVKLYGTEAELYTEIAMSGYNQANSFAHFSLNSPNKPMSIYAFTGLWNNKYGSFNAISDFGGALNYYYRTHEITFEKGVPPSPIVTYAKCNCEANLDNCNKNIGRRHVDCGDTELGTHDNSNVGSNDDCRLAFSIIGTNAESFNIYHATENDPGKATLLATRQAVQANSESIIHFQHNNIRDGKTHYYYISSVSDECGETGLKTCNDASTPIDRSKWTMASCTTNIRHGETAACDPCSEGGCSQ